MSLHNFVSQVQLDVVLNPKFMGVQARYSRRIEDSEGDSPETKSVILNVSPQGNFGVTDKSRQEYDARLTIFWAKTEDLKFDDEPFVPKEGDMIEYEMNGVLRQYRVPKLSELMHQSSIGIRAAFSYEDGLQRIIKIMTIRQQ